MISKESAHAIENAKSKSRRIIAIGTGVARAIESASLENGKIAYGNLASLIKLENKSDPKTFLDYSAVYTNLAHPTGIYWKTSFPFLA